MKFKTFFEVHVPDGLEAVAWREIGAKLGGDAKALFEPGSRAGVLQFTYGGAARRLLALKTALSAFWGRRFDVPRPKALLGHEAFSALLEQIHETVRLSPAGSFRTLYLAAAGSETAVMQRLAEALAKGAGLVNAPHEGDLLVRVRRPLDGSEGWEALVRLAPRPLSVRQWRVCDYTGALNAAVAHAMVLLTRPQPDDVFLNICCGSGTLLIERASAGPAKSLLGCDTSPEALDCAQQNVQAAGYAGDAPKPPARRSAVPDLSPRIKIALHPWDARALPLPAGSASVIVSDLPFGHDVGSHEENLLLYPQLLKEAGRVAAAGARGVFLTHEVRLFETVLNVSTEWILEDVIPIAINGLNPRIYVVSRAQPNI